MTANLPDFSRASAARYLSIASNPPSPPAWLCIADAFALRDTLRDQVAHAPQLAIQLFERARDAFGSVGERRLWRALAWLASRGLIVRDGVRQSSVDGGWVLGYGVETSEDALARERIDCARRLRCFGCGASNRTVRRYCRKCQRVNKAEHDARHGRGRRPKTVVR